MNKWKGRYIKIISGNHKGKVLIIKEYVSRQENGIRIFAKTYKDGLLLRDYDWYIEEGKDNERYKYINEDDAFKEIL